MKDLIALYVFVSLVCVVGGEHDFWLSILLRLIFLSFSDCYLLVDLFLFLLSGKRLIGDASSSKAIGSPIELASSPWQHCVFSRYVCGCVFHPIRTRWPK